MDSGGLAKQLQEVTASVVALLAAVSVPGTALWLFLKNRVTRNDSLKDAETDAAQAAHGEHVATLNRQITDLKDVLRREQEARAAEREAYRAQLMAKDKELSEARSQLYDRIVSEADRARELVDRALAKAHHARTSSRPPTGATSARSQPPTSSQSSSPKTPR